MILVYAAMVVPLYQQVVPDRELPGGTLPGLGTEAILIAVKYAAITAIPLSLLFFCGLTDSGHKGSGYG